MIFSKHSLLRIFIFSYIATLQVVTLHAEKPQVVATFSILADWVKNVCGEQANVTTLIGANGDPHHFEPSPSALRALSSARIIFKNGLNLEPWLDAGIKSASATAQVIDVSIGIPVIPFRAQHEHGAGCSHDHGEFDPHIWQNPRHAIHAVKIIRNALIKLDPINAELYRKNSADYISRLLALDREISEKLRNIPRQKCVLVTNHHSMGYFAQRYNFRIAGNVLNSPSTEASDPPPSEIARLAKIVREQKIPAIFSENTSGNKLAMLIAREAGVPHVSGLHTDALGNTDKTNTYIGMMTHNADLIYKYLSQ